MAAGPQTSGKGHGKQRNPRKFSSRTSDSSTSQTFRSQVLRLRNAGDPGSVTAAAAGLKGAVLDAARVDVVLDDALLGMAASQCARHKQADLMGLLCAQAVFRLSSCSGRSVAELASAAVKLDCVEAGFSRAVTGYCASPPQGAFTSIRDIAMVASALRAFVDVDHASALSGLASAAMPYLNDGLSQRDLADLLHQLAQLLFSKCGNMYTNNPALRKRVCEVLSLALNLFKRRLHRASAMDVAMVAGVIAGLWPTLEAERETMLHPCLLDIAQLVRFRRTEFNPQDLANLAIAFAKVGLANSDVAEVLDEQTSGQLAKFSNKDVALLLCAAARLPTWSSSSFAKTVASQLLQRDLTKFSPQDLCTSAQSLAKLGGLGAGSLQRLADEAFQRQLCAFTGNDKAILLWSLAKVRSKHSALLRILVRGLAVENFTALDRDLASATIWALARIWPQLPPDQWPQQLFNALCTLSPWVGATASELCCTVWAAGQLAANVNADVWSSLLTSINNLFPKSCSLHELCLLLCGLSSCPNCQEDRAGAASFITEVVNRIQSGQAEFSDYDKQLLKDAFTPSDSNSWEAPSEISDIVSPRAIEKVRTDSFDEFNESETEFESFVAKHSRDMIVLSGPTHQYCRTCKIDGTPKAEEDGLQAGPYGHRQHGHGHGHGCILAIETNTDLAASNSYGTAHGEHYCDGQGHGHSFAECTSECGHDCCSPPVDLAVVTPHGSPALCPNKCCPTIFDSSTFGEVRLNAHCDFDGHCIQLKNTFIHIQCNHTDTDQEDCMVCKMTRSRSCDVVQRSRFYSDDTPKTSEQLLSVSETAPKDTEESRDSSPTRGESRGRRLRRQKQDTLQ